MKTTLHIVCALALIAGCDGGGAAPTAASATQTDELALANAAPVPAFWTHSGAQRTASGRYESVCQVVSFNGSLGTTDARWQLTVTETTVDVEQHTFDGASGDCSGPGTVAALYTLVVSDTEMTTLSAVFSSAAPLPQNVAGSGPLSLSGLVTTLDVQVARTWLALPLGSTGRLSILMDDSSPAQPRLYVDFQKGVAGLASDLILTDYGDFSTD